MGLFSRFKPSDNRQKAAEVTNVPSSPASSPFDTNSKTSDKLHKNATTAAESAVPKDQAPGYDNSNRTHWPANPHAGDYQARIAQLEADAVAKEAAGEPRKKNWIKDKFNLVGPDEPEYYERRYTKSGNGSDYEQNSMVALIAQ